MLTVGSFLLTVELFYSQLTILAFLLTIGAFFAYNFSFFSYSLSFFAYNGKVHLIRALRDCKQRSLTGSKKAPTVSKKSFPPTKKIFSPSPPPYPPGRPPPPGIFNKNRPPPSRTPRGLPLPLPRAETNKKISEKPTESWVFNALIFKSSWAFPAFHLQKLHVFLCFHRMSLHIPRLSSAFNALLINNLAQASPGGQVWFQNLKISPIL